MSDALKGNLRGAGYMMGVTACFTTGDAFVRAAAEAMPLFQVVFLRSIPATLILGVLVWLQRDRLGGFTRRDRVLIGARSVAEVAAMIPFFIALSHMPFANVSALLQALPLCLTLAGAFFLGESVGWRRLSAIGIGFAGVLMIVQPGGAGFNAYSLLVLLTVAFVVFRDLSARRISRGVPVLFMAFVMSVFVCVASGILSLWRDWGALSPGLAFQIFAAALCIIGGYVFAPLAMRHGEIGFVTPFRYLALVWAVLIGFFAFGEWPDAMTVAGSLVVVSTGLYTLYRERRLSS